MSAPCETKPRETRQIRKARIRESRALPELKAFERSQSAQNLQAVTSDLSLTALSAGTIALEISSRNSRVAALQKRWDRLRTGLDVILDQRAADMADLPGGASGLLVRSYKGKEADRLVTRIDHGVVSLLAELPAHEQPADQELGQWKTASRSPSPSTPRRRRSRSP